MRKVIFAINSTIDGYADHTAMIADDELHDFFTDLLKQTDTILFGRETYQLMESFWPNAKDDPRNTESMIRFADAINSIRKIIFSQNLDTISWQNSILYHNGLIDTVRKLKQQDGKVISVGSISLASQLTNAGLIDEYWFLIHPVILGKGRKLFDEIEARNNLNMINSKIFKSGVVALHYLKVAG